MRDIWRIRRNAPPQLFCFQEEGLVGAVGIENNDDWNLKDLREMRRNAKALKRNNEACKEILIAPSKLPRFSRLLKFQRCAIFTQDSGSGVGIEPNFSSLSVSRPYPLFS